LLDAFWWQHLWACCSRSACVQEKQFPQNKAAAIRTAMIELENVRIEA
jgi:hypothetical protein